jgi:MFS family permease
MRIALPTRRNTPLRTLALISANSLTAAVQGQFMFVLPWMLLARGSSPQVAALSAAFVYVPMLATALPAGAWSDAVDPLRLMRWVTAVSLAACSLYPLAALAGKDWFALVLLAAVVVGAMRNLTEGAVFRALADTTHDAGLLRAHAIRQTVNQAALFSTAFVGLLLFRAGGPDVVLTGICLLYVGALAILAIVPELGHEPHPDTTVRERMVDGIASLRGSERLRTISWVTLCWSLFGGAALALMPAVLRQHMRMDEVRASATFLAGMIAVVALTLPLVRRMQARHGPLTTFVAATVLQGATVLMLAEAGMAELAPLLYCLFLLTNSVAAASLGGARAAAVEHEHQGLLNLTVGTVGLVGFLGGVVLAAGLLGPLGFGAVLALVGAGMALTALGFRRSLVTAAG